MASARGGDINRILDGMAAKQQGNAFQLDTNTQELAVVSGKHSIEHELNRLAQRDAPEQTFQMDPKTQTLEVASGPSAVRNALAEMDAQRMDGQKKQNERIRTEDAHDESRANQLGLQDGGTPTLAAALRDARKAAAPARDVASGKSEGSHVARTQSRDSGRGGPGM